MTHNWSSNKLLFIYSLLNSLKSEYWLNVGILQIKLTGQIFPDKISRTQILTFKPVRYSNNMFLFKILLLIIWLWIIFELIPKKKAISKSVLLLLALSWWSFVNFLAYIIIIRDFFKQTKIIYRRQKKSLTGVTNCWRISKIYNSRSCLSWKKMILNVFNQFKIVHYVI